jgi:enediyne biosynthesis protein E4
LFGPFRSSRRSFLTLSSVVFGTSLLEALARPLSQWTRQLTTTAQLSKSDSGIPVTYVDVAKEAGLNVTNVWGGVEQKKYIVETKGSGIAFFDYDHDGWLDVYLTNGLRLDEKWPPGQEPHSHLFRNNRDGTFTDVTDKSGLGQIGWQTGVCVGDYDNDGWDDLFCGFWGHNALFHNNGDGTFTNVTRKAGLYNERVRWTSGSTWLDYDRDGCLDLFVANFVEFDIAKVALPGEGNCQWMGLPAMCGPRGLPPGSNMLFHNNGDGTFTDVSEKSGILKPGPRYSITPVSYDFDNDGWPDIYVAVDSMPSLYFRNNHDGTFTERGVEAGCALNDDGREQAGMGVAVGDYDCDGNLDIFKTNFSHDTSDLYHNNGDGTFADKTYEAGVALNAQYVGWGDGFVDYDNDGWPDIIQINGHVYPEVEKNKLALFKQPRVVYRNLGNGKFEDVSVLMGPGIAQRYSSRGAAFGDYDNDGDIDVLVLNMNDPPSLLRNDGGSKNNWIKIKLIGTHCNRTAIGARVRVSVGGHTQMDEVHSGGSVMSQGDLRLHFGLGRYKKVNWIEVKWPTTWKIERFSDIEVNQILTIQEGAGIVSKASAHT